MAVSLVPGFPDLPSHRMRIALGGRTYGLRFTFRARTASWYVDLFDADGGAMLLGQRVSPGWSPLAGYNLDAAPDSDGQGVIVIGPDPYDRAMLGDVLRLVHLDAADVVIVAADLGYRVAAT